MIGDESHQRRFAVHAGYGTVYQDGEFVQRGAVLGLSVDARGVVVAPVSGWIRRIQSGSGTDALEVEISPISDAPGVSTAS